jgi:phosphatidylinositol-4,5-bisphosphate 3-kinase
LRLDDWRQTPKIEEIAKLEELLKVDPLNRDSFTKQDKYILIKCRNHYKSLPYALAIFLCAIDWSDPE